MKDEESSDIGHTTFQSSVIIDHLSHCVCVLSFLRQNLLTLPRIDYAIVAHYVLSSSRPRLALKEKKYPRKGGVR